MDETISLTPGSDGGGRLLSEIASILPLLSRYGLTLTDAQIHSLVTRRNEALISTGRIEFGTGILKKLITEFADSPYVYQSILEETLFELTDIFYYFKNESEDDITDDELIALMRRRFDTLCQGSLEFLSGLTPEELISGRYGGDDDDDPDGDE